MKTFRRYLLSYLLTLFLPVGILSIVISQIVLHYCAAQLLDSNAAAVQIMTVWVSKGLQYPVVYLPYAFSRNVASTR